MSYTPTVLSKHYQLNAVANASASDVIPLVELSNIDKPDTASRFGQLYSASELINDKLADRPFFLDICPRPEEGINMQDYLLRPSDGYANWRNFLAQQYGENCLPILQCSPDDTYSEIRLQATDLLNKFASVGVRIPAIVAPSEIHEIVRLLRDREIARRCRVFIDFGQFNADQFNFCRTTGNWNVLNDFLIVKELEQAIHFENSIPKYPFITTLSTSWPMTVIVDVEEEAQGNGFAHGARILTDRDLWREVQRRSNLLTVEYGDYGGRQLTTSTTGGQWIPRIDLPKISGFEFYRQRTRSTLNRTLEPLLSTGELPSTNREAIGICARYIRDTGWINGVQNATVKEEIRKAANGKPTRSDPGYWKGVRMTEHITVQANDRTS